MGEYAPTNGLDDLVWQSKNGYREANAESFDTSGGVSWSEGLSRFLAGDRA